MTRLFGTNGVRGIIGESMTPELATDLGRAVATWLGPGKRVGVGRDARDSGPMLQAAFTAGLNACGVHAVSLGVCGSPGLQLYIRDSDLDAGAIITASHNPPEWNGIKLIAPDGTETVRADEERVEAIMALRSWKSANWQQVGTQSAVHDVVDAYVASILRQVDADAIRRANLKVVLDPGGGAGCVASPLLLEALGVDVVAVACELDGAFSSRPSEPTPDNAKACIAAVKESGANLGILHDGDADRAVFIDEHGDYVWGDAALALVTKHELPRHEARTVVTGVSSSSCVADAAASAGGVVDWTRVGSPVIARRMLETGAPLGGEDNGGFMFARHLVCRDGLMAAAFMLELIATSGKSFRTLIDEIPSYALEKRKVAVADHEKAPLMARLQAEASQLDGTTSVDLQDGVKASFAEGWFLIRASGTEPIVRVQAEGKTPEGSATLADRAEAWLNSTRQSVAAKAGS